MLPRKVELLSIFEGSSSPIITIISSDCSSSLIIIIMEKDFEKRTRKLYLKEFKNRIKAFENHPLLSYEPDKFKFIGEGGQAKVLSFYSGTLGEELVVKIYSSKYKQEAENEF